jgi:hypothetical protein
VGYIDHPWEIVPLIWEDGVVTRLLTVVTGPKSSERLSNGLTGASNCDLRANLSIPKAVGRVRRRRPSPREKPPARGIRHTPIRVLGSSSTMAGSSLSVRG